MRSNAVECHIRLIKAATTVVRPTFETNFAGQIAARRALLHLQQQCGKYVADPAYQDSMHLTIAGGPVGRAFFIVERALVELEREFEALKQAKAKRQNLRAKRKARRA